MIPALSALFTGDRAEIGAALTLDGDDGFEPLEQALTPKRLREILDRFGQRYARPDLRATASQWSKWYVARLVPPVLAANLALDWRLPLDVEAVALRQEDDRPHRFRLTGEGGAHRPADPEDRFGFLVEDHLGPVVAALAHFSGASPKVFWSNAGAGFESVIGRVETLLGADHPAVLDARGFLRAKRLSTGRANPLFEPIRYRQESGAGRRERRICCIRYLTPELPYCKSCPLEAARRERAEAAVAP